MRLEDLPKWNDLTPEEQNRLREVFGDNIDANELEELQTPPHDAKHEGKEVEKHIT